MLALLVLVVVVAGLAVLVVPQLVRRSPVAQMARERRLSIEAADKASRRGRAGTAEMHERTADALLERLRSERGQPRDDR